MIELKAGNFKPEHAGQLYFYLTAVDEQLPAIDKLIDNVSSVIKDDE